MSRYSMRRATSEYCAFFCLTLIWLILLTQKESKTSELRLESLRGINVLLCYFVIEACL